MYVEQCNEMSQSRLISLQPKPVTKCSNTIISHKNVRSDLRKHAYTDMQQSFLR